MDLIQLQHRFLKPHFFIIKGKRMKRILFLLTVFFCYGATTFAQGWEGTIQMTMKIPQMGDETIPLTMNIKGNKIHTSMEMGAMGAIEMFIDNGTKKMVQVMRAAKMGMEFDMSQAEELAKQSNQETPVPVATGKKEMINGYDCELYTAKVSNVDMEMWMTNALPKDIVTSLAKSMSSVTGSQSSSGASNSFEELAKKGLFAVRTIVKDGDDIQMQNDILKFEAKSIPDSEFTIPTDINIQKMDPSMMGGGR